MSDSINQSLAANVLRLGDECRDLAISNAVLRQENEELHKDYESLADEHTKLIDRNARLKADVERLTAMANECEHLHKGIYSLSLNVVQLKDEVERLRKAGDAVALDYAERIEIEAGETAKTLMKTLPVLREWNAAKDGKPSV